MLLRRTLLAATALVAGSFWLGTPALAAPEVVKGPGYLPECFKPWTADTKYFQ